MSVCRRCSRTLTADEIAVYKRMVNRGADTFLCAACLAAEFHVPESLIHEKIAHFRAMGCTLFSQTAETPASSISTNSAPPFPHG
ncbi:MAG: hypothetical protein MR018_01360 [Clostridiales bacterium]|nr:hypothetical protein [Clostridiales bacterium]MDD7309743.1 hypothetical protein [Eubacteriales bacterium]MDY5347429.1 hypothetical protein [Eubacteriales bacterium]